MSTPTFNLADLFEIVADDGPRPPALVARRRPPHLRRARRAGQPRRPAPARPRRRARRPRRRSTPGTAAEWIEAHARLLQGPGGPDQRQLPLRRRRAALPARQRRPRRARLRAVVRADGRGGPPRLPDLRHLVVLDDGSDVDLDGCETSATGSTRSTTRTRSAAASPDRADVAALGRRPLHPLHRRHHRHAQGRDVARTRTSSSPRSAAAATASPPIETPEELAERIAPEDQARSDRSCSRRSCTAARSGPCSSRFLRRRHVVLDRAAASIRRGVAPRRAGAVDVDHGRRRRHGPPAGRGARRPAADATGAVRHVVGDRRSAPAARSSRPPMKAPAARAPAEPVIVDSFGASASRARPARSSTPRPAPGSRHERVHDGARRRPAPGRARSATSAGSAARGHIPLGYYKDAAKTAATFLTDPDGVRWVIPGDFAAVEADGTITLLGRGSVCINTGGEKVFPEEVEAALKAHPDVFDALVVGVPDERFGERVAAIVEPRPGHDGHARQPGRARPHATSPGTRCRGRCGWSTRSAAPRRARPTTSGRRSSSRQHRPRRSMREDRVPVRAHHRSGGRRRSSAGCATAGSSATAAATGSWCPPLEYDPDTAAPLDGELRRGRPRRHRAVVDVGRRADPQAPVRPPVRVRADPARRRRHRRSCTRSTPARSTPCPPACASPPSTATSASGAITDLVLRARGRRAVAQSIEPAATSPHDDRPTSSRSRSTNRWRRTVSGSARRCAEGRILGQQLARQRQGVRARAAATTPWSACSSPRPTTSRWPTAARSARSRHHAGAVLRPGGDRAVRAGVDPPRRHRLADHRRRRPRRPESTASGWACGCRRSGGRRSERNTDDMDNRWGGAWESVIERWEPTGEPDDDPRPLAAVRVRPRQDSSDRLPHATSPSSPSPRPTRTAATSRPSRPSSCSASTTCSTRTGHRPPRPRVHDRRQLRLPVGHAVRVRDEHRRRRRVAADLREPRRDGRRVGAVRGVAAAAARRHRHRARDRLGQVVARQARARCSRCRPTRTRWRRSASTPSSLAGIQARAMLDAGVATERDFAEVVVAQPRATRWATRTRRSRATSPSTTCSPSRTSRRRCASTTCRRSPTARRALILVARRPGPRDRRPPGVDPRPRPPHRVAPPRASATSPRPRRPRSPPSGAGVADGPIDVAELMVDVQPRGDDPARRARHPPRRRRRRRSTTS